MNRILKLAPWASLAVALVLLMLWIYSALPREWQLVVPDKTLVRTTHDGYGIARAHSHMLFADTSKSDHPILGPDLRNRNDVAAFRINQSIKTHGNVNHCFGLVLGRWPVFLRDTSGHIVNAGTFRFLEIPFPYLITFFLILPAVRWTPPLYRTLRSRWIIAPGRCPHCGYDLRATPEATGDLLDRCPECGHATSAVKTPIKEAL